MATTANRTLLDGLRSPDLLLLRDCLSMGSGGPAAQPSARRRLEEAVGRELARRLVSSLTATGSR